MSSELCLMMTIMNQMDQPRLTWFLMTHMTLPLTCHGSVDIHKTNSWRMVESCECGWSNLSFMRVIIGTHWKSLESWKSWEVSLSTDTFYFIIRIMGVMSVTRNHVRVMGVMGVIGFNIRVIIITSDSWETIGVMEGVINMMGDRSCCSSWMMMMMMFFFFYS